MLLLNVMLQQLSCSALIVPPLSLAPKEPKFGLVPERVFVLLLCVMKCHLLPLTVYLLGMRGRGAFTEALC